MKGNAFMKLTIKKAAELACENVEKPIAKEGYALFKVKACGVCGSDIPRILDGKAYFYPITVGHEFSGIVEDSTNTVLIGKRAAVFPILPCGECEFCKKEEYANCVNYDYYGSRRDGGMQDYLLIKEENLVFLPDNVSYAAGAMAEPCAVTLHAAKKAQISAEDTVLVYGAGTIGLISAMWARHFGAKRVVVFDIDQKKLELARELGFDSVTDNDKPTVIIEASGAGAALNDAIARVSAFGRVVIVGNASRDMTVSVANYSQILRKQISLFGSWNSNYKTDDNDWSESIEAISKGYIDPERLVTHRLALDETDALLDLIGTKGKFFQKIIMEMN